MHFAIDLDGTIDAAPELFTLLMTALHQCDIPVTVLTGNANATTKLKSLGLSECADQVVILPDDNLPAEKSAWCVANGVDVMIDNKTANCQAAVSAGVPVAFVALSAKDAAQSAQRSTMKLARARINL